MTIKTISELNDKFRHGDMNLGHCMMTSEVQALAPEKQHQLIQLVRNFDSFTLENDPYQEHDFGKVKIDEESYFWKIDYYDNNLTYGSEDPANLNLTKRVLTIMRSDEY